MLPENQLIWSSFRSRLLAEHGPAACATPKQHCCAQPFSEVENGLVCGMQFMCRVPAKQEPYAAHALCQCKASSGTLPWQQPAAVSPDISTLVRKRRVLLTSATRPEAHLLCKSHSELRLAHLCCQACARTAGHRAGRSNVRAAHKLCTSSRLACTPCSFVTLPLR